MCRKNASVNGPTRLPTKEKTSDGVELPRVWRRKKIPEAVTDGATNIVRDIILLPSPPRSPPLNIRALNVSYNSPVLREVPENERGKHNIPSWADQCDLSDSDVEVIDTSIMELPVGDSSSLASLSQLGSHSDPEEWHSLERKKKSKHKKYIDIGNILSPHVKCSSKRPGKLDQ
ncbi:hypothetical protein M5689_006315 [Euphorbia peplus]|nr:hypothetical protein M5689_006315 [Euphorbia peplus]